MTLRRRRRLPTRGLAMVEEEDPEEEHRALDQQVQLRFERLLSAHTRPALSDWAPPDASLHGREGEAGWA